MPGQEGVLEVVGRAAVGVGTSAAQHRGDREDLAPRIALAAGPLIDARVHERQGLCVTGGRREGKLRGEFAINPGEVCRELVGVSRQQLARQDSGAGRDVEPQLVVQTLGSRPCEADFADEPGRREPDVLPASLGDRDRHRDRRRGIGCRGDAELLADPSEGTRA